MPYLKVLIKEMVLHGILVAFLSGWAFSTLFVFFHFGFIAGSIFGANAYVLMWVWAHSASSIVLTFVAEYIRYGLWPEAVIEPRASARGFLLHWR